MYRCINMGKISIAIISNIILEPQCKQFINIYFGNNTEVFYIKYGEHNENEYKRKLTQSDFIVVWLNFEELFPDVFNNIDSSKITKQQVNDKVVGLCVKLFADITQYVNAHTLWILFEDLYIQTNFNIGYRYDNLIDQINTNFMELLSDKVSFVDIKRIIAEVGILNAYDAKGKYRWNAPYSKSLIEVVIKAIHKQYIIENGITKKCIVLDCDNVLWGGILSEDGIDNLYIGASGLGRSYQDFQRYLLFLYHHGVILTVCSKNELPDIMYMFNEHDEMILKEEHIAYFRANWENKADNIREIAHVLNIELDSMVFIDDSDFEIQSVKQILPEVTAVKYERDTIYNKLSFFNLRGNVNIEKIILRNRTYKTNEQRNQLKANSISFEQYLCELEMKVNIHLTSPVEYARIAELTQRTNKCTNGIRYTVAELKRRNDLDDVILYSVSVKDCFSDLGLVGALEIEGDTLTLFSLSCRALGREIESKMLEFIVSKHNIAYIKFNDTGKNGVLKTILTEMFSKTIIITEKQ